jgi:hypothetical protein
MFLRALKYFEQGKVSLRKLKKIAQAIILNLVADDDKQTEFLIAIANKMDQTRGLSIHLDMTQMLAELHLKYGQYTEADELIVESEMVIPLPPDKDDNFLCQSSLNFFIMKLDILMFRKKFKKLIQHISNLFKLQKHWTVILTSEFHYFQLQIGQHLYMRLVSSIWKRKIIKRQ